jgi:hypothetical protein
MKQPLEPTEDTAEPPDTGLAEPRPDFVANKGADAIDIQDRHLVSRDEAIRREHQAAMHQPLRVETTLWSENPIILRRIFLGALAAGSYAVLEIADHIWRNSS